MAEIIEINQVEQLEPYRLAWTRLLLDTPGASFFQTFDWLKIYWKHFGQGQRLRVLVVLSGGEVIGIVPLCVRRESYRVGRLRVLTYPLHDWGTYYGPIGPNRSAALALALRHLRATERDWDLLDLRWTDRQGTDRGRTLGALRAVGWGAEESPWATSAVIALRGNWDDYQKSRSQKWRANRRWQRRHLERQGKVVYQRYRPPGACRGEGEPRWDLLDACETVARRSWQAASTTGTTITHALVRPFLRECHAAAARLGMLDLNLLWLDGRPIAFAYGYHWRGRVSGLRMGYDQAMARWGCGNVLLARTIRDAYQRGDHCYDLGPGSFSYKRQYATGFETSWCYTHFPATDLRAQLVRLKRWMVGRRGMGEREKRPAGHTRAESCTVI